LRLRGYADVAAAFLWLVVVVGLAGFCPREAIMLRLKAAEILAWLGGF